MPAHTFTFWPEYARRSYQVSRIIGLADFGASDFQEVYQAIQHIDPADDDSWSLEWERTAKLVERTLEEAEAHNNLHSIRYAHQRASNYYRLAADTAHIDDPRKLPLFRKTREHFLKALPYQETRVECVEIPYDNGVTLDGFFVHARWADGPAPTLIWVNGADSLADENYFNTGIPAANNGYNALFYDHPGPGLALYEKGLTTRYDCEHFVSPAVDYLMTRPDVDKSRIILGGPSFASYLVPRAAAFEKRLAAAVSVAAMNEFPSSDSPPITDRILRLYGAKDEEELREIRKNFTLKGILEKVTCPFFVIVGADDWIFPASNAIRYLEELGSEVKKARVIERDNDLGGVLHCQKDNLHMMQNEVFNWLNEVLGHTPPRPS